MLSNKQAQMIRDWCAENESNPASSTLLGLLLQDNEDDPLTYDQLDEEITVMYNENELSYKQYYAVYTLLTKVFDDEEDKGYIVKC